MKFLVAPEFNQKLASLRPDEREAISFIVNYIRQTDKDNLGAGASGIEVRSLTSEILTIRHAKCRIYASIGSDEEGEYLILLDLATEVSETTGRRRFFATRDPKNNPSIDPNRNIAIDPRRNITIDPNRNIAIDPRRNITIDPNRNIAIDPRRNITIDPNRNITIDPRRNRSYGGPYVYNFQLDQEGFIVRANEKVSLIFDLDARFTSFVVATPTGIANVFDLSGNWIGFLVPAANDLLLRFNPSGQWLGIIV